MSMIPLKPNLKGVLVHEVKPTDLATNWRNNVPVLATPVLLWLAELACMRAIEGTLEEGRMTLGFAHDVQHLAPTPLGWTIRLEAALEKIDGKLLTFLVEGSDGSERILAGRHTRAIVDRDRFLSRFEEKRCSHV